MARREGPPASAGRLLIIGGHEDREHGKQVLARFLELSGGPGAPIVVVTAASAAPAKVWAMYKKAFADLGATDCRPLHLSGPEQAGYAVMARALERAGGVFLSGGDQKRLPQCLAGTPLEAALHAALARGACIAGTSAGASAMAARMLAGGHTGLQPLKGAVTLAPGLGFVGGVVIDQHFAQRHRLARLMSVIAEHPRCYGVGIDEDTALLAGPGPVIEVLGAGSVTILDGRAMESDVGEVREHGRPRLLDMRVHLLPSGSRFALEQSADGEVRAAPQALRHFIHTITTKSETWTSLNSACCEAPTCIPAVPAC